MKCNLMAYFETVIKRDDDYKIGFAKHKISSYEHSMKTLKIQTNYFEWCSLVPYARSFIFLSF